MVQLLVSSIIKPITTLIIFLTDGMSYLCTSARHMHANKCTTRARVQVYDTCSCTSVRHVLVYKCTTRVRVQVCDTCFNDDLSVGFHSGRRVDRVAKKTIAWHLQADNSGNGGATVDT